MLSVAVADVIIEAERPAKVKPSLAKIVQAQNEVEDVEVVQGQSQHVGHVTGDEFGHESGQYEHGKSFEDWTRPFTSNSVTRYSGDTIDLWDDAQECTDEVLIVRLGVFVAKVAYAEEVGPEEEQWKSARELVDHDSEGVEQPWCGEGNHFERLTEWIGVEHEPQHRAGGVVGQDAPHRYRLAERVRHIQKNVGAEVLFEKKGPTDSTYCCSKAHIFVTSMGCQSAGIRCCVQRFFIGAITANTLCV